MGISGPNVQKNEKSYLLDRINLSYRINNSNSYAPYLRCLDLGKRQTIAEHNTDMRLRCEKCERLSLVFKYKLLKY